MMIGFRPPPPQAPKTKSKVITFPAPVGGWNAFDAVPDVAAFRTVNAIPEAITLDNWIVDAGGLRVRRGYSTWATGLTGLFVETLMEYAPKTGSNKFFGAATTVIWEITTTGAATSSKTSMTNARWQHAMLSNASGSYMYCVNGADTPIYYDGSAWNTSAFTGLTLANLIHVTVHMNRLWFVEKDTMNGWYAPVSAVAGALTKFDFGGLFRKGGYLVAIGSWTRDGGSGPDDLMVVVTSRGQMALYSGTDPSAVTTAALVGVFDIPYPIGRRCIRKAGGDIAILTSLGLIGGQKALSAAESGQGSVAVTNKISGAFQKAYAGNSASFGWQTFEIPNSNLVMINAPQVERATQVQFVANTQTGAWSRFTGLNAGCWGLFNGLPYFGGNDGKVYRFDDDYSDGGFNVVATMQTAFANFQSPNRKRFVQIRPYFLGASGYTANLSVKVDYDISLGNLIVAVPVASTGTYWDASFWDSAYWASGSIPSLNFSGLGPLGIAASIAFSVSVNSELFYNGADLVYEEGGLL